MNWRDQVDPLLKIHLEREIMESVKNRKAYTNSENPNLGQLWIAVANLSKKIFDLDLKFDYLNKTLKEVIKEKKTVKKKVKKK